MRGRGIILGVLSIVLSGAGAKDANACIFGKHHRVRSACPPGTVLASRQSAPVMVAPAPQAPAQVVPVQDPVTFLLGVVTQQQPFQINQGGVQTNVQVQLIAVP